MLNLVLKDFLVQKKTPLISIIYSVFFFIVFRGDVFKDFVYIMGSVAISYIYLMYTVNLDEKNKSDLIINSLPVTRRQVVMARYLFYIAAILSGILTMAVAGIILKTVPGFSGFYFIKPVDFLAAFSISGILASFHAPLAYKFGINARYFDMAIFFGLFFAPGFLADYIKRHSGLDTINYFKNLTQHSNWNSIGLAASGFTLIIIMISLAISIKIYESREF
ncbi:ABC-2 transporter permease [Thermoanaerobacterium sp. DL9XJH110]|uniref:ABC-2 transporter permease n=1 Tax=Thermoanaerobacterium sp. DL9XJH110 TaxID=3386643 RepID=UPI003BB5EF60